MVKREPEQRKGGRPRREDGPKMPYHEVDRLLVEGELVAGADGAETRVWPSQREVAKRFNVAPSLGARVLRGWLDLARLPGLLAR